MKARTFILLIGLGLLLTLPSGLQRLAEAQEPNPTAQLTPQTPSQKGTPTPALELKQELELHAPQRMASAPPNDDFDSATLITSFAFVDVLNTTGATVAPDDPNMGCGAGVNSNTVWYRLVAPLSGIVEATTEGSNYDTVLAAFTGSRGALSRLVCNDDAIGLQSRIRFSVERGQTYFLEVADYGSPGGGTLRLSVNITYEGRFGERIYVRSATPITISFWSNPHTGYNNLVGLASPEGLTFGTCRGSNVPPPTQIGPFAPGSELIFFLNSRASDAPPGVPPIYYNGPASRNPDNRVHTNVTYDPQRGVITLGWEDMWNTGDRDFDDCVMTLTGDIGIIEAASTLQVLPNSVPADGSSTASVLVLLVGEDERPLANHRVRLESSRGNVDIFTPSTGTTDANGIFVATIRSFTAGTAVITVRDLTTGRTIPVSASVTFTPIGGEPPPPPASDGPIAIIEVKTTMPLAGMYPTTDDQSLQALFGDTFLNHIDVTVDWRGSIPRRVDFVINGITHSVTANSQGASYELNMSRDLQEGVNDLRIVAYNTAGQRSNVLAYAPVVWEMPLWLVQLLNDASVPYAAQETTSISGTRGATASGGLVEIERVQNPKAVNIWFKIPPRNLISRVYVPVGKFETKDVQVYARLQIPLEGQNEVELRGGARYLNEFERRRAAGFKHKGLSILGTEFVGEAYVFGRARFDVFILRPEAVGGGASYQVSKTWERTWLALLYLFGLPDPTPALRALPVVGDTVASFIARIASGYFTLEGRGNAEFTYQLDPVRQFDSFDLILGAGAEIGMRADIGIAEIKGYYGADADSTFLCLRNAVERDLTDNLFCDLTFKGSGRMQVKAFAWEIPVLEFPSFEKRWPEASLASIETGESLPMSSSNWQLIRHISTPDYARFRAFPGTLQAFAVPATPWLRSAGINAQTTITSVLVSNVYTYAWPSLAMSPTTGKALLLWAHDDSTKPIGQSHEIAYSRWDGATWSLPARVTDDPYLDGAPQVVWDANGNGLAVWERLNDPRLPITATLDITTTRRIEIAWAQYNSTSATWSAPAWLTTNTALDHKPTLARNSTGNVLAVWRQNAAGLLSGDTAKPDRVMFAMWDGSSWSTPAVAVNDIPGLVDLTVGYGTGTAIIAHTRFLTPTGALTPTLQLFTSTWDGSAWSAPQQLTDDDLGHTNPQVVYNNANQPLLVWQAGNTLRLRNLSTGVEVGLTLDSDLVVDEFRLLHDAADNLAAVFTGQQAGQRDLFVAFYDALHDAWGRPYRLTNDRHSEGYPAPALDSAGRLLMAYALTQITSNEHTTTNPDTGEVITYTLPVEGQTDLYTLSHQFVRDLTIGDLSLSDDHPQPGTMVIVSATVTNSGALALADVQVAFYDGDPNAGGTLIGTVTWPGTLASGHTATLTTTYTVPLVGGQRQLAVVADPEDQIAEADETNNQASLLAFGPDLELVSAGVDYWGSSQVGLVALVRNIGTTPSPATAITYHWDTITGTVAVTDRVPTLEAGGVITLTTPWDYGALAQDSYALVAVVNEGQQDFAETFTDNNQASVTLDVLPDLAVSPLYLWTDALPDARVLITATVYNFGSVASPPVEVAFYVDEVLTDTRRIGTVSLSALNPGSQAYVTALWDTPTGGEHTFYVTVNPRRTLSEITWANNVAGVSGASACMSLVGDVNCSCSVDTADIQAVAGHWRQRAGDPGWDARFDLDGDGDVDVADVMRVARMWGTSCP